MHLRAKEYEQMLEQKENNQIFDSIYRVEHDKNTYDFIENCIQCENLKTIENKAKKCPTHKLWNVLASQMRAFPKKEKQW